MHAQDSPPIILHSAVGAGVADVASTAGPADGKFFVGRLQRVQKNGGKSKRWALMDNDNQVAAFVAPTTKYDLRRFLGKEIGVTARTFSEPDGAAPYVIVDAVTPMFANEWSVETERSAPEAALVSHESEIPDKLQFNAPERSGAGATVSHSQVIPAQQWEPTIIDDGAVVVGDAFPPQSVIQGSSCGGYGGCGHPGCTSCASVAASTSYVSNIPCGADTCGPPGWMWIRGENIQWWSKGMRTPPLVTSSTANTVAGEAGVLGLGSTSTVYGGDDEILTDSASGFRLSFGGFFGQARRVGYQGEFFSLTSSEENFSMSSDANGNPILARPFFNVNPRSNGTGDLNPSAREDAELVSFPGLLRGTVAVNSYADLRGASGMLRWNKCCKQGRPRNACCDPCCGGGCGGGCGYGCGLLGAMGRCGYPAFSRVDFLVGYQYLALNEGLQITEDLTSLDANNLGTFNISDMFETENSFHGAVIGTAWEGGVNRWTLELMMRMAIGAVDQTVSIDGETTISPLVTPAETLPGGLLAQRTNIGEFERSEFTMIPQLNANLGFYLTPHLRAVLGYSLIYWGNVVRPGEHIDLDLNPDLLPPEVSPFTGALRPGFEFNETDYWVQGLNIGLDFRW